MQEWLQDLDIWQQHYPAGLSCVGGGIAVASAASAALGARSSENPSALGRSHSLRRSGRRCMSVWIDHFIYDHLVNLDRSRK